MSRVLILTEAADIVAYALPHALPHAGLGDAVVLHTDRPETWPGWTLRLDEPGGVLHLPEGDLDLGALRAVWAHRVAPPASHAGALYELIDTLEALPAPVLDRSAPRAHARYKMLAHELARGLGLRPPRTFLGNGGAAAFATEPLIFKTLAGSASTDMKGLGGVLTSRVDPARLMNEASLQLCPVLLQEEIPRRAEIRAIVVDDEVFAAELPVDGDDLDWRRLGPSQVDLWRPHALPAPIAAALVALHRALGLRFGAADLLQTPDGAYRFLEVNSTGGFLWVSDLHGGAALRAVLRLLRDPWTGIGRGCPPRGRQLPTPHAGRPGEESP